MSKDKASLNNSNSEESPAYVTASPISDYIHDTINGIEEGVPEGYKITKDVSFDLSLVHKKQGGGKVDLRVLGLGGNISKEQVQRVTFSVSPIDKVEEAERLFKLDKLKISELKNKYEKQEMSATLLEAQPRFSQLAQKHKKKLLDKLQHKES